MALNQYISVKVCGNPDSNSGFVPILLFNSPSFAVEDQFYVGFDNCSYFYTIKTTKSQTIYKLVKNNVRSYGAARAGSLVIAFSVPKNFTVDGGYTPYDVLEKLKNEFLKKCMTCKDAVRETYEFNSGRIDQHVLDDIASEFTLSPQQSPDRVMNPTAPKGYIVKSDAEIEKLFHDINYPEFDNYSEVIVADSVNQTSYTLINNIQIPRLKSYAIYVDGEFKMSCADVNQSLTVSSNKSLEFYDNKKFDFSIQNLKDGDIIPGIELQEVNERVIISTQGWATPKRRTIGIKIVPTEFENYFYTNRHLLKLKWPYGIIKLDQNLSFTLEGEQIAEIKKETIRLELEHNGKFTLSQSAIYGNELRVTVEEIKCPTIQEVQGTGQNRYQQQGRVTDLQIVKPSPVYDVSILLLANGKFEDGNEIDIKLKTHPEKPNTTLTTCRTRFKAMSKSKETFEGHFYVSKELYNPYLYLCFQTNGKSYITKQPLSFSNDKTTIEERDFEISKTEPFYKKRNFLIKLLIPFIAILLGFIIGFASHDVIKTKIYGQKADPDIADTLRINDVSSMTEEQASDFLNEADSVLRNKDLKFSTVQDVYDKYMESKDILDVVDETQFKKKICARIRDYKTVVSYVTNGNVEELKNALGLIQSSDLHVRSIHAELLKQIVKDEATIEQFRNKYSEIQAFDQISSTITPPSSTSVTCDKCGAVFDTETALVEHRNLHATRTFVCNKCSKSFDSQEKLDQHKSSAHKSAKTAAHHPCPRCGPNVWFKSEEELKNHSLAKHER